MLPQQAVSLTAGGREKHGRGVSPSIALDFMRASRRAVENSVHQHNLLAHAKWIVFLAQKSRQTSATVTALPSLRLATLVPVADEHIELSHVPLPVMLDRGDQALADPTAHRDWADADEGGRLPHVERSAQVVGHSRSFRSRGHEGQR